REDPPILGNIADPETRHSVGWRAADRPALEPYLATARMNEAGHRLQRRALADPVAPEEAHHFPSADLQRDTIENMALAVIGVNLLDREERLGGIEAHVF